MREEEPTINHQFDVWHLQKTLKRNYRLYQSFLCQSNIVERHNNAMDMFNKINFQMLTKSIKEIGTDTNEKVKGGLKLSLYYLLLSCGRIFEAKLRHNEEIEEADIVKNFLSDLKLFEYRLFGDARLSIETQQKKISKKPSKLPLVEDLKMIRKYCVSKMQQFTQFDLIDTTQYIELRNCAVVRLTLLNGRRGGEPARLLLEEFKEGMEDNCINNRDINMLDSMDQILLDRFKVCYQSGKGRSLVPLLLPEDTFKALQIIADPERRKDACVSEKNPFLFAPTNGQHKEGENHVQG